MNEEEKNDMINMVNEEYDYVESDPKSLKFTDH
jgi:hypothetical protein